MSGQLPTDPAALVGAALWRILLAAGATAVLLLLFGPFALVLVLLGGIAWLAWRGGVLPTALPMPGLAMAGVVLLGVVLFFSGGGLLLLALVALGLIIAGLIGPARLRAAWQILRAVAALVGWLVADPARLRALRDTALAMKQAAGKAAEACRPGGAARAPIAGLSAGLSALTVAVPKATQDATVTMLDLGKAKVSIPIWRIEASSVSLGNASGATTALAAAEAGLAQAATQLDGLAQGFGLIAEGLEAAAAVLPPEP